MSGDLTSSIWKRKAFTKALHVRRECLEPAVAVAGGGLRGEVLPKDCMLIVSKGAKTSSLPRVERCYSSLLVDTFALGFNSNTHVVPKWKRRSVTTSRPVSLAAASTKAPMSLLNQHP